MKGEGMDLAVIQWMAKNRKEENDSTGYSSSAMRYCGEYGI